MTSNINLGKTTNISIIFWLRSEIQKQKIRESLECHGWNDVCVYVCERVWERARARVGGQGEEAWKLTLPAHTPFATTRASSNHICNSKNAEGSYSIFSSTTIPILSYKALFALLVPGNSSGVKWGSAATTIVAINKWMNQNEPAIHPHKQVSYFLQSYTLANNHIFLKNCVLSFNVCIDTHTFIQKAS